MMLRIAMLGIEILRLDWADNSGDCQGDLAGYELVEDEDEDEVEDEVEWSGQQQVGAYIERDHAPLSPEQRFEYEWEDKRRFGFG